MTVIQGFLLVMRLPKHIPAELRSFIDSSKQNLNCVLFHICGMFACIPTGHSVILKEHYKSAKIVLQKLYYDEHKSGIVDGTQIKLINNENLSPTRLRLLCRLLLSQL